jgi:hypothetical protein
MKLNQCWRIETTFIGHGYGVNEFSCIRFYNKLFIKTSFMSTFSKLALKGPLRKMFPEEWLRKTARETGLVKCERKLTPLSCFGF